MSCPGKCSGCAGCGEKLGAVTAAPPLAFAGWRLRVGGNPPGGQYHGYLGADRGHSPWEFFSPGHTSADGVYRSPGETPPSANPNRETNTLVVTHARQRVGDAVVPGALGAIGPIVYPLPALPPVRFPFPIYPTQPIRIQGGPKPPNIPGTDYILTGSTSAVPQTPPVESPAPAPTVPMNCPPEGTYRDAAGNLVCDWHNPYSLYLPSAAQIQPGPVVNASTALTPGAGQTPTSVSSGSVQGNAVNAVPSWFTDPSQEVISGIPNWGILAAAAAAFFLMKGRR